MSNPKTFRPWLPEQAWLLPPSPIDWLPKDHLVFFLLDLIDQLDLDPILQLYRQKDARGEKAYEPRMMVVLLLYTYCVGMPSSRKIERACYEVLPFRVLSGNQQPDHTRIREFRRRNRELLEDQAPVAPSGSHRGLPTDKGAGLRAPTLESQQVQDAGVLSRQRRADYSCNGLLAGS